MSRSPNAQETVQLRISTTPSIQARLDELVETGLYGKNAAEAAERLLAEGVRQLIREGLFLGSAGEADV